jgi:heme/copper-type cytochrome/quinol oxidase subunit 2
MNRERGRKRTFVHDHKSIVKKSIILTLICIIIVLQMVISHVSAVEMTHRVQVTDIDDSIVVYVTTSQNSEITLERSVPVKLSEGDIRYGAANYKVIGLNCVVGKHATFRLQPLSRTKDVVIPITLKYGNQSRTFTYTILAEEVLAIAPVVAAQPVAPESTPVPVPGKSDIMMVVLGASVVLITVIIGISVFQIKRSNPRGK